MNAAHLTATLLLSLVSILSTAVLGAQADVNAEHHLALRGPGYAVEITDGFPQITWDGRPAQERLTVTGPSVGYVVDDAGEPKLLLYWGKNFDNVDRAYVGDAYFQWALGQVQEGRYWDYRERDDEGHVVEQKVDVPAIPRWRGERVVRLSNPGHELRIVVTPEGATATDNGSPVEVSGRDGDYRIYANDYEAGVSVKADGYVYHYYKPLR